MLNPKYISLFSSLPCSHSLHRHIHSFFHLLLLTSSLILFSFHLFFYSSISFTSCSQFSLFCCWCYEQTWLICRQFFCTDKGSWGFHSGFRDGLPCSCSWQINKQPWILHCWSDWDNIAEPGKNFLSRHILISFLLHYKEHLPVSCSVYTHLFKAVGKSPLSASCWQIACHIWTLSSGSTRRVWASWDVLSDASFKTRRYAISILTCCSQAKKVVVEKVQHKVKSEKTKLIQTAEKMWTRPNDREASRCDLEWSAIIICVCS